MMLTYCLYVHIFVWPHVVVVSMNSSTCPTSIVPDWRPGFVGKGLRDNTDNKPLLYLYSGDTVYLQIGHQDDTATFFPAPKTDGSGITGYTKSQSVPQTGYAVTIDLAKGTSPVAYRGQPIHYGDDLYLTMATGSSSCGYVIAGMPNGHTNNVRWYNQDTDIPTGVGFKVRLMPSEYDDDPASDGDQVQLTKRFMLTFQDDRLSTNDGYRIVGGNKTIYGFRMTSQDHAFWFAFTNVDNVPDYEPRQVPCTQCDTCTYETNGCICNQPTVRMLMPTGDSYVCRDPSDAPVCSECPDCSASGYCADGSLPSCDPKSGNLTCTPPKTTSTTQTIAKYIPYLIVLIILAAVAVLVFVS